jgi:hypothetical protein
MEYNDDTVTACPETYFPGKKMAYYRNMYLDKETVNRLTTAVYNGEYCGGKFPHFDKYIIGTELISALSMLT